MKSNKQSTVNSQQKIDIEHIAKLANLELTQNEKKRFSEQLTQILGYVAKLSEVDTKNVRPLAHAAGLKNVWRNDSKTLPSLTPEVALANTKQTHNDFFKVKAIFDDASASSAFIPSLPKDHPEVLEG